MFLIAPPSTLPPHAIVDAYLRDSGGPTQERSTRQQETEIRRYCQEHNLRLRHIYTDEAKSGGSVAGRENFNRMLDACIREETRPQGLLLWNYARFARDLDDAIYYKALLKSKGIIVHSLTDPIPEGHYGRIVELFIDISNEEKRRQTSSDAKRGLRELVLRYKCVPGTPPRGFRRVPNILLKPHIHWHSPLRRRNHPELLRPRHRRKNMADRPRTSPKRRPGKARKPQASQKNKLPLSALWHCLL